MQVVVATYGSRGDVEPMVALAAELQAREVDVRLCVPPDDELVALAARAGVAPTPFARPYRSWLVEQSTAQERVPDAGAYVEGHVAATYRTLAEAAAGAAIVLATGMLHFVARTAAEQAGAAHRFVVFSPSLLGPKPWHPLVRGPIDAHRATLGLPPVEDLETFLFGERPWVAADPLLAPAGAEEVVRTPAWVLPDDRPLPLGLEAFLAAGEPPVHVGFGSMRMRPEAAAAALAAVRAHGRRVVLARGWAGLDAPGEDCLVVGDVNHQALFPRVAAVVHHGGAGTTTAAARAGVPQVVVPQVADQPHWAARVAELGLGVAHDGPDATAASLTAALGVALDQRTRRRAAEVATRLRRDGAAQAAELLLRVPA